MRECDPQAAMTEEYHAAIAAQDAAFLLCWAAETETEARAAHAALDAAIERLKVNPLHQWLEAGRRDEMEAMLFGDRPPVARLDAANDDRAVLH